MREQKKVIVISSTARDLPEHRKEVMDACLRQGMFPQMMEHLPATDADAVNESLRLVDQADIYLGIFANRYGHVPKGHKISITEMEYDRAVERGIPRLIFFMHDDHLVRASDVETGRGATRLKSFKKRVAAERVANDFKSPAELRANVIDSLSSYRERDETAFHYVSDIPEPPEPYIAHPYTLLQTHGFIGRQQELNLLTDWVAKPDSDAYQARILNVVAIGGMGKSALTWKWFNDIAPQEMNPLAGRMWWSFYESDASFENFVTRALAYITRLPLGEVNEIPLPERETQLLAALDREPFLLVMDGLERVLIAYPRMKAAHLQDGQVESTKGLRKTADPRVGRFLKKLAQVKSSRILVSTRLYPAELETDGGDPIPGTFRRDIQGLTDEDAVELWRAFGVSGSRDELLPVFEAFGKHPLLIQALAGEVKRYRPVPGDFQAWRRANPHFDPARFPQLQEAMSHVLEFALYGLSACTRDVLQTIAAFRMPTLYDTLASVLIGQGKPCVDEHELDEVLNELEDRGLIGWDRRANRYELHPIVRGVVWGRLDDETRHAVYTALRAHLEALPDIDEEKVNCLEDLTPAIELYNTLIGLERYSDAIKLFQTQLSDATLSRLSASRLRIELLQMLFPDGINQLPRLRSQGDQAYTLNGLALGYQYSGQPGRAASLFRRAIKILWEMKNYNCAVLCNLSEGLRLSGALYESESTNRRALITSREKHNRFHEAMSLRWLGLTFVARGLVAESEPALQRASRIFVAESYGDVSGDLDIAQKALWSGRFHDASSFANRGWELAHDENLEAHLVRAIRLQGEAFLGLHDLLAADEWLHDALARARIVDLVEEELPVLVALAELQRRRGDLKAARDLLEDVWESAERGPYPLFHADAFNVLAQIERDAGNNDQAIEAATNAYRKAWCDGPPFAYHWGLVAARKHLAELNVPEPSMPPFNESKYEPMPEVEIDPPDLPAEEPTD